jgi:D-alanine--poly(phosphoribitol) ligase subunit 1
VKDVTEFIREAAKSLPDNIAVVDGDRKITYSDFVKMVDSLSRGLNVYGQKPKVIVDLPQGIESYALIIAIYNIGGIYCPLNPESPIARNQQVIDEFQPNVIVCTPNSILLDLGLNALTVSKLLENHPESQLEVTFNDDDVAYIIYTSGSTGSPKGVMIYRKALHKFLEWSIPTYDARPGDVWGQFSLLSFDLSIVDVFTCLCSGATLFAMNDLAAKKNRPAGIIERNKITIWHSIPSAVEFMIANEESRVYDYSSLRLISFCGEPLRKHHVEFLFKKKSDLMIFNTYGPTEGTLFCTCQALTSADYLKYCDFTMSIGTPIPGWEFDLRITDQPGESEIIIYGDFIGRGYTKVDVESKFKEITINGQSQKAFETGDIVALRNGSIYFLSRKDRQVKIKGYRVELDEIDFWINEFTKKTCITLEKSGVLYSFIESNGLINEQELRDFLKSKMELYKIPNSFYSIDAIPRSQNQKVDVQALTLKLK